VQIDKARCDPKACAVDGFFGGFVDLTNVGDAATLNSKVCDERFLTCAVNKRAVFN